MFYQTMQQKLGLRQKTSHEQHRRSTHDVFEALLPDPAKKEPISVKTSWLLVAWMMLISSSLDR